MPTQNYIGNWDNFTEANADDIENLFSATEHEVLDYHRTTATSDGSTVSMRCKTASDVEDGTDDDIKGLIVLLASDLSRYITGQDIGLDGGFMVH